ncbi:MAG: deoxyribodipyrimidine photo-lyase [Actinobacteria bacterium]|nr:deoxyribodipyrimidine photo-lyase [Actinomycetota bacterium]
MSSASKRSIFWFRRDLRLADNPALLAAIAEADEIVPVFIMDEAIAKRAGDFRRAYLADSLRKLDDSLNGGLHVISGDPVKILRELQTRFDATSVHVAADYAPYGVARDEKVESAGIELTRTGSPYAVAPGRVQKSDETPYRVYTPFYKAWSIHGWRALVKAPQDIAMVDVREQDRQFPNWKAPTGVLLQSAGELAAHERWKKFRKEALNDYDKQRNLAGIDGTSRLSPHLRWGEIHPRTLLAGLGEGEGPAVFRKEIAWREFYADVLHHNPLTTREYYAPRFANMRYDEPGEKFTAWCEGKTGFPFVDAAMRQLRVEGWMHNRTRMVVASFLVKDLHLEWQHGANFFMKYLIDNDVASNSHGWQWTAGCGTDASPYYRIFNPIEQGKRFDEQGHYIRKFVPELRHLSDQEIHEPWDAPNGYLHGYPPRIVDHATERNESLARLQEIKVDSPEN